MKQNRRWLVFANNEKCNHGRSFAEQGFVSWNPHGRKFAIGDTVYLFFSQDRAVRVKAEVVEVGVPRADKAYWNVTPPEDRTCKLQLVAEYEGDALNESVLMEALSFMIAIHEPRFKSMVNDLTDFQMSLVKATLDGVVKFSASEVIEQYKLNSSANVRRLKDALKKKEIITFDENEKPYFLDPLFQYWLEKYYY